MLTPDLTRHDGALYGGTGAAAAVMMMEAATQRDAVWVATQFVAQARIGERIDLVAHVLAEGKRIAQVHVVAHGRRPDHLHRAGRDRAPAPARTHRAVRRHAPRHAARTTARRSIGARPCRSWPSAGSTATSSSARRRSTSPTRARWRCGRGSRRPRRAMTAAGVAFVADMVPGAIARAAGKLGGGFSLDNALRFAEIPATEWVLLHLRGDVASHGYGHGSFTAWSSDGALLATGSQTASMTHVFDGEDDPQMEEWRRSIARDRRRRSSARRRRNA